MYKSGISFVLKITKQTAYSVFHNLTTTGEFRFQYINEVIYTLFY